MYECSCWSCHKSFVNYQYISFNIFLSLSLTLSVCLSVSLSSHSLFLYLFFFLFLFGKPERKVWQTTQIENKFLFWFDLWRIYNCQLTQNLKSFQEKLQDNVKIKQLCATHFYNIVASVCVCMCVCVFVCLFVWLILNVN